jgi:histidyl-tRNA synthetase
MLKGTKVLIGQDAEDYERLTDFLCMSATGFNYDRVYLPSIWEAETFEQKIQGETLNQLWKFKDKGDRNVVLVPEITGIIQELYNDSWSKSMPKPVKVYYLQKCFRYEQPQLGRLREFTQFGVEYLSPAVTKAQEDEVKRLLEEILDALLGDRFEWHDSVVRGLGYYTTNGFEATYNGLGAQKQIAGGGRYVEGVGWAIGVERILLALKDDQKHGGSSSDG